MAVEKTKSIADIDGDAYELNLTLGEDTEKNWKTLRGAHNDYSRLQDGGRVYERRLIGFFFLEYRRLVASDQIDDVLERKLKEANIKCNNGTAKTTKYLKCHYAGTKNDERRASSDGTVIAAMVKHFEGADDVSIDDVLAWIKKKGGLDAIRKRKVNNGGGQSFEQRCETLLSDLKKAGDIDSIDLEVPDAKQQELILLYCIKDANNKLGIRRVCRPQQADLDKKRFDLLPAATVHKNGQRVVPEPVTPSKNPETTKSTGTSAKTPAVTKRKAA